MAQRSLIIIGAGIAGLSAGCYGQMNDYATRIFEMGDRPGGLCTSWMRDGYTFNGSIQWLVGTRPGGAFSHLWRELGALPGRGIVNHDEYLRCEDADGAVFHWYADGDRLERHMRAVGPDDGRAIDHYLQTLRHFARADWNMDEPRELLGPVDLLKSVAAIAPAALDLRRYSRMTAREFAGQFTSPLLRAAFGHLGETPVLALLMWGAFELDGNAGYPIGGSASFAEAIARRYADLGGDLHLGARVAKVLVEDDRAVGVRLADGSEHRADAVISAADGHTTIFEMLDGRYVDDAIRQRYATGTPFPPYVQVALGVARDLSGEPYLGNFPLPEPITIAGRAHERLQYMHYGFDPSAAPPGKAAIIALFPSDYAPWQALGADAARYHAEKEAIARQVIAALEPRFPGITAQVEVVDVTTPLTYERYTGNWQGSPQGWAATAETMANLTGKGIPKTLPGLANFFMAGQWVESPGGGIPPSAASGMHVIQLLCHADKRPFRALVPEAEAVAGSR